MGTADSDEYEIKPCAYQALQADALQTTKRWNKRVLVEPLIILAAIFAYCTLQAIMQQRDLQAQLAKQTQSRAATCQIQQNNTLHQFNCTVMTNKLAVIQ